MTDTSERVQQQRGEGEPSPNSWFSMLGRKGVLLSPIVLDSWPQLQNGPAPVPDHLRDRLQRAYLKFTQDPKELREWLKVVFEDLLGHRQLGVWQRGNDVDAKYRCDAGKPDWVLHSAAKSQFPRFLVFIEDELATAGKQEDGDGWIPGRLAGKTAKDRYARILRIMAASQSPLAVMTNGHEFRLIFQSLDHDLWAQWRVEDWFGGSDGRLTLHGFVALLGIQTLPCDPDHAEHHELLNRVQESRDKQGDLSFVMGTQVREAVELLLEDFNTSLKSVSSERQAAIKAAMTALGMDERAQLRALYQGAIRVVMRLVVILYAEARGLLPRDQEDYLDSYSVDGLYTTLRSAALDNQFEAMQNSRSAWLRLQSLFLAIYNGTHHDRLDIPGYGGQLFEPAAPPSRNKVLAALQCLSHQEVVISDDTVHKVLRKLKIGQFRVGGTWRQGPVDFSDLRTEFIGMMYEGLLDYDLRIAREEDDGIIFLNVGDQPALPFKVLATMSDKQIKELVKESKQKAKRSIALDEEGAEFTVDAGSEPDTWEARVHTWAVKAAQLVYPEVSASALKKEKSATERNTKLNEAAQRLILKKVEKGGYYLVAWSGTRKGSGTFYTKPGLAVPTARRTIEPKVYNRVGDRLVPKTPAEILSVKVCDPAMGSGAFPVAALRYMSKALAESIEYHVLKKNENGSKFTWDSKHRVGELCAEVIEVSKKDENWRDRLEAKVKRLVAEHCIYGVDLNPLAVELGKLALWIETMDKGLRFTFLDHRVKQGNSLVGAWLHQIEHYPIAAWARKAGTGADDDPRRPLMNQVRTKVVAPEFKELLDGLQFTNGRWVPSRQAGLGDGATKSSSHAQALVDARNALVEIHGIYDERERELAYRSKIENDKRLLDLKYQLDKWTAVWFWPILESDNNAAVVLGPKQYYLAEQSPEVADTVRWVADEQCFLHWELAFPDVFNEERFGFDVMLGNPPWEVLKPNSLEFFTRYDPAFRQLGKSKAKKRQDELFLDPMIGATIQREWLDENEGIKAFSNYIGYAHTPHQIVGMGNLGKLKEKWLKATNAIAWQQAADAYEESRQSKASVGAKNQTLGGIGPTHPGPLFTAKRPGFVTPYYYQGHGNPNLYQLMLEKMAAVLLSSGRLGLISPSGIYGDPSTRKLRDFLLQQNQWEWVFGFENRKKIFDIDSRFKFAAYVITRGGRTERLRANFMRHELADWSMHDPPHIGLSKSRLDSLMAFIGTVPEIVSREDETLVSKIAAKSSSLADLSFTLSTEEYHLTKEVGLFEPWSPEMQPLPDGTVEWKGEILQPTITGKMFNILAPFQKRFEAGEYVAREGQRPSSHLYIKPDRPTSYPGHVKIAFRRITNSTNTRTLVTSPIPQYPCGESSPSVIVRGEEAGLRVAASWGSLVVDYFFRNLFSSTTMSVEFIPRLPVLPTADAAASKCVAALVGGPWSKRLEIGGAPQTEPSPLERARLLEQLDLAVADAFDVTKDEMRYILRPDNRDPRNLWRDYQKRLEILERAGMKGNWYTLDEARTIRQGAGLPWTAAANDDEDDEEVETE